MIVALLLVALVVLVALVFLALCTILAELKGGRSDVRRVRDLIESAAMLILRQQTAASARDTARTAPHTDAVQERRH